MFSPTHGLCRVLTGPLKWLPQRLHTGGLSLILNRVLADPMAAGELDFLRDRVISIEISDLGTRYCLVRDARGFAPAPTQAAADVRFSGDFHTLLLLLTQREDADTLFFQRRLRIQGDTATGLHLKNFLDALGEPPLPRPARLALERFADLYARRCGDLAQPVTRYPDSQPYR